MTIRTSDKAIQAKFINMADTLIKTDRNRKANRKLIVFINFKNAKPELLGVLTDLVSDILIPLYDVRLASGVIETIYTSVRVEQYQDGFEFHEVATSSPSNKKKVGQEICDRVTRMLTLLELFVVNK